MLTTPHILVGAMCGAACGILLKDPVSAFIAGFFSHLVLDLSPHLDQEHFCRRMQFWKIIIISVSDCVLGVAVLWLILWGRNYSLFWPAVAGAIGGVSLDVVDNLFGKYLWKGFRLTFVGRHIHRFHEYCHTNTSPRQWILGVSTQVASSFASVAALYYL